MNNLPQDESRFLEAIISVLDDRYVKQKKRPLDWEEEARKPKTPRTTYNLDLHKNYLLVPYEERGEAYEAGAFWDSEKRLWHIPGHYEGDRSVFNKWRKYKKEGFFFMLPDEESPNTVKN